MIPIRVSTRRQERLAEYREAIELAGKQLNSA
jgi:hypothetical protein